MDWKDISLEKWREYEFPNGQKIRIESPKAIAVTDRGSHRIVDVNGIGHYIAAGFLHIAWDGPVLF